MGLIEDVKIEDRNKLKARIAELDRENARLRLILQRYMLPEDVDKAIMDMEDKCNKEI